MISFFSAFLWKTIVILVTQIQSVHNYLGKALPDMSETGILPNFWVGKRWLVRFIPVGRYMLSATVMFVSLTYSSLQILVGQRIYVRFPANIPIVENRLATFEHRQYCIVKIFAG